jgi:hypothetical protein
MYAEGGWSPRPEPPRRPRLTPRQERLLLWLLAANALILLIAPLGGSTVVHALVAALGG